MKRRKCHVAIRMLVSGMLIVSTLLGNNLTQSRVVTAQAAENIGYEILSDGHYAKCYTLSDSGTTIPYTSDALEQRGTITNGASNGAFIDNASDELWLKQVGQWNGTWWAKVAYPNQNNKRLDAYIPLSAIVRNDARYEPAVASGTFYCFPRVTSAGVSRDYYVEKGDTVYLLSTEGDRYQIMYPTGKTYRIAFCTKEDYNQYCGEVAANSVSDGIYMILSGNDTSKALDVEDYSLENQANLQIYDADSRKANQKFYISSIGNGYYQIAALHSGKALDVAYSNPFSGANVQQYSYHGLLNQQWELQDAGDGYYYILSRLGTALDNAWGNAVNNNNVQTYEVNQTNSQRWKLVPVDMGTITEGTYVIESGNSADRVLDINGFSTENGGNLEIYERKETDNANQQFAFRYKGGGYYQIIAVHSGKALDVENQSPESFANCHQWEVHDGDSQLWQFLDAGDGYYYIRNKLGCYLNNVWGSTELSNNVMLYQYDGTEAEKWRLHPVNTEEQDRKTVVEYMRKMATVEWTPQRYIPYWNVESKFKGWPAGSVYKGIPYTQKARETTYEKFCNNLNGMTYIGPVGRETYKGSDCSSSVCMAWKQINPDFPICSTEALLPGNKGIRKVGLYNHTGSNTKTFTNKEENRNVLYVAYKQLQPGDVLVERNGDKGHVMMVSGVYENSVTVIEQTTYDSGLQSTWRVDKEYSFDQLYQAGYLPVTMDIW